MTGDVYFNAPEEYVTKDVKTRAVKLGMPECRGDGRAWHFKHVLTHAARASVHAWEDHVRMKLGLDRADRPNVNVSITQRPGIRGEATELLPPLLQRTQVWSIQKQRLLLPLEKMQAQGFVIFNETSDFRAPFMQHLQRLSSEALGHFAGNGMHLPTMGTLLAFSMTLHAQVAQG